MCVFESVQWFFYKLKLLLEIFLCVGGHNGICLFSRIFRKATRFRRKEVSFIIVFASHTGQMDRLSDAKSSLNPILAVSMLLNCFCDRCLIALRTFFLSHAILRTQHKLIININARYYYGDYIYL